MARCGMGEVARVTVESVIAAGIGSRGQRYVFAYTITIENNASEADQLLATGSS